MPTQSTTGGGTGTGAARMPATSYDVARLAGVSQSAVSRAFRTGASISAGMRAKVERAAVALGYAPSQIARSLITQRSGMIGVVITDLTVSNYPDVMLHLGREIQATGHRMLVFTVPDDGSAAVRDLLRYHVEGIVSSAALPDEVMALCAARRVPLVLYNRAPQRPIASAVGCDHAAGMEHLVAHLEAGGLGRCAFLAGPPHAPVSAERLAGAGAALAVRGHEIAQVVHGDYAYESGRAAGRRLLDAPRRPDTLICANDAMALGVLDAARHDLGLSVPRDVAVAGFDDLPQAAWPTYDLTTLRQPVGAMARAAIRLLLERVEAADEPAVAERRLMAARLMVRGSTRDATALPDRARLEP